MSKRPVRPPRRTLVEIDNPDDAELQPDGLTGDGETLVVYDSPDDVEAHAAGQPPTAGPDGEPFNAEDPYGADPAGEHLSRRDADGRLVSGAALRPAVYPARKRPDGQGQEASPSDAGRPL